MYICIYLSISIYTHPHTHARTHARTHRRGCRLVWWALKREPCMSHLLPWQAQVCHRPPLSSQTQLCSLSITHALSLSPLHTLLPFISLEAICIRSLDETHTLSLSLTHTQTHTHTHTHNNKQTNKQTHTHTHTRTNKHTHSLSRITRNVLGNCLRAFSLSLSLSAWEEASWVSGYVSRTAELVQNQSMSQH